MKKRALCSMLTVLTVMLGHSLWAIPENHAPTSLVDAEFTAGQLQKTMEGVWRASPPGKKANVRDMTAFTGLTAPLNLKSAKPVSTKVQITLTNHLELKNCWIPPWTGPMPAGAAETKFTSLQMRLSQKGKGWIKAFIQPEYFCFFRQPNSPVYLGKATITGISMSKALSRALPIGGYYTDMFKPMLQMILRQITFRP